LCAAFVQEAYSYFGRHGRSSPIERGTARTVIHGAFCVGCCRFLMLLLFVGGVMSLAWIAGLALLVLLEKTVPHGHLLSRAVGVALTLLGGWWLMGAPSA
jgi:predicted metal-binding membrane protein